MNRRIITGFVLLLGLFPAFSYAQIQSDVSASAETGGNHVASGGVVKTGDSSVSVNVETVNESAKGTTTVHIETTVNGQKHEETYAKQGGIRVSIFASSSGSTSRQEYRKDIRSSSPGHATSTTPFFTGTRRTLYESILQAIKSAFSWFAW